jgi:TPR repeat protein
MYDNGYGVEINHKKANIYYKLAADQGHMEALYNIGLAYGQGTGVKQNIS